MTTQNSALRSTIAYKLLMAVTGLVLIGFLVAHLLGNLLVFVSQEAINEYGIKLREYPLLLWGVRGVLLLSVVLHIYAAVKLTLLNKSAKPINYDKSKQVKASLSSRTMFLSGFIVLFFIIYHLAHLTFKWTHQEMFAPLNEHDVYSMLVLSFHSPLLTSFYVLSIVLLTSHLYHGVKSFFQTMGMNHSKYNFFIKLLGPLLSFLLAIGFVSIPLSILFRVIE